MAFSSGTFDLASWASAAGPASAAPSARVRASFIMRFLRFGTVATGRGTGAGAGPRGSLHPLDLLPGVGDQLVGVRGAVVVQARLDVRRRDVLVARHLGVQRLELRLNRHLAGV